MHQPPSHLVIRYRAYIAKQGIASADVGEYQKWLRFFLDFSEKYQISGEASQRVSSFLNKLREKHQSEEQMRRAFQAVSLYFEMIKLEQVPPQVNSSLQPPQPAQESHTAPSEIVKSPLNIVRTSHYSEAGYQEKTDSPEWDVVLEKLAAEIKLRHYSRKTLKTYAQWSRKFQRFLKNKPPGDLKTDDVKAYLTYLAVDCHVAASTQNQAFLIG